MKWYEKQKQWYKQNGTEDKDATAITAEAYDDPIVKDTVDSHDEVLDNIIKEYHQDFIQEATSAEAEVVASSMDREGIHVQSPKEVCTTIITEQTKITGDVTCDDNLVIDGVIIGQVVCTHEVQINGTVEGDITCKNTILRNATIHGNITSENKVEIFEGSDVTGFIKAKEVHVYGNVIGNVEAEKTLVMKQTASILGDVCANELEIERGAKIKGDINIEA